MSTIRKLIVFVVAVSIALAMERVWLNAVQPQVARQVAVAQINGNENDFRALRLFETYKSAGDFAVVVIAVATGWWLLVRPRRSRSDFEAVFTALRAASSQETELVPMTSVTR